MPSRLFYTQADPKGPRQHGPASLKYVQRYSYLPSLNSATSSIIFLIPISNPIMPFLSVYQIDLGRTCSRHRCSDRRFSLLGSATRGGEDIGGTCIEVWALRIVLELEYSCCGVISSIRFRSCENCQDYASFDAAIVQTSVLA